MNSYQSLLIVSFGGPEGPDDVLPFLENVLRGKNVPRERMEEVAEHYQHFGGVSPINQQCRDLISALEAAFAQRNIQLPIYWGNRNWEPYLPDALQAMTNDGITRSLAFFTSAFSCYSGCRQYRENIADAQKSVGESSPEIHKLRMFFNHPLFVEAVAERVRDALQFISEERRQRTRLVFTAHSIPLSMAEGCQYERQLQEASRLVANALSMSEGSELAWNLVYQSRSGPPAQPWLEPDVCDFLPKLKEEGVEDVVLVPIGFLSDHMEVLFDLDTEAKEVCDELGLSMQRAKSVGTHPKFIDMICELVVERMNGTEKLAIGNLPASHDVCPENCCQRGARPVRPAGTA